MGCGTSSSVKVNETNSTTSPRPPPSQEANASSSDRPSPPPKQNSSEATSIAQSTSQTSQDKDSHTTDKPPKHSSQVCDTSVENTGCNNTEHTDFHVDPVMLLKQTDQVDSESFEDLCANSTHSLLTDEGSSCVHEQTPTESLCAKTETPCSQSQMEQPVQFVLRQNVGYSLSTSPRIQQLQLELGFINTITADQDAEWEPKGKENVLTLLFLQNTSTGNEL